MMKTRSRMRAVAALGVAVLGAVAPVTAQAAPHAGRTLRGTATFYVVGTDGVKRTVSVLAEEVSGASSWGFLEVRVQACTKKTCTEANTYGKALEPGELELNSDGTTAQLETEFAGAPLSIVWIKPATVTSVSGSVSAPSSVSVGDDSEATVSAEMLGFACNSVGSLADLVEVYGDRVPPKPAPEPTSLPKGFAARGKARPACA